MRESLRKKIDLLSNTFCPTGEGGGQDNSCGGEGKKDAGPPEGMHPIHHKGANSFVERLQEGSYIDSETVKQAVYTSHDYQGKPIPTSLKYKFPTVKKYILSKLAERGLTLVPKKSATLKRTPRGGASMGTATGYTVQKIEGAG